MIKRALKFCLLPRIAPRFADLVFTGFRRVAVLVAMVYGALGLLPPNHPYLNPANVGRFGVINVITQAANGLKFDRRNVDKVAVYFLTLVAFVLLGVQLFALALSLFAGTAHAIPIFTSMAGDRDVSYILLDRIFGVQGIFNSCVAQNIPCFEGANPDGVFPTQFQKSLHGVFALYSKALLITASIITLYILVGVIDETARTGVAFGNHFNRVWAPLRIAFALGMLVPLGGGLNSAQYITLYTAKFAAGFASNGWAAYVQNVKAPTILGDPASLIARPNYPQFPQDMVQFYTVVATCVDAYKVMYNTDIKAYFVRDNRNTPSALEISEANGMDFRELSAWAGGDLILRYGEYNPEIWPGEKGYVTPLCGELVYRAGAVGAPSVMERRTLADKTAIDSLYDGYLRTMLKFSWDDMANMGEGVDPSDGTLFYLSTWAKRINAVYLPFDRNTFAAQPTYRDKQFILESYRGWVAEAIDEAYTTIAEYPFTEDITLYGWAGAGVWYNKIAQINGDLAVAINNLPQPTKYPIIMERVKQSRMAEDSALSASERYQPTQSEGKKIDFLDPKDALIAQSLYSAYKLWDMDVTGCEEVDDGVVPDLYGQTHRAAMTCGRKKETGNKIIDMLGVYMGPDGVFNMRANSDVHPLAQLSMMGRIMMDHAINSLGFSAASGVLAVLDNGFSSVGAMARVVGGFARAFGSIFLVIGAVLYYVIPLMPFVYFFFAVGGWVKAIFEAMVGAPLWALAHLNTRGEGFPTKSSHTGYYLLLEIFLRPILIVFGLILSATAFSAMARTLNDIWPLVTSNTTGFAPGIAEGDIVAGTKGSYSELRGVIDQFFFTIIYTIVVYMMAQASFKLIDLVPQKIMRWMGQNLDTFAGMDGQYAENIARNTAVGLNSTVSGQGIPFLPGGQKK